METIKREFFELDPSRMYDRISHWILSALIAVTLGSMAIGVVITISHLKFLFTMEIEQALHKIILDVLTILAILEIYKTILAYFSEGRVKISFIIDTVIVIVLTEMIGYLFREFNPYKVGMMLTIVIASCIMRIFTVKYSPSIKEHE